MAEKQKELTLVPALILGILFFIGAFIFLVPVPYTTTEIYTVQEPYTATEKYTEMEPYVGREFYTEQEPVSEEECRLDILAYPEDYINRGIDALLSGDLMKLITACEDVIKYRTVTKSREVIKYQQVEKERDVTKYKSVQKERKVIKKATIFMMLTGQVDYFYED